MDLDFGTGFVCAPSCGDVLKLSISIDDDGIVEELRVKTFGCDATTQIEQSMDILIGMSIEDLVMIGPSDLVDESHIGVLIVNGIRAAVTDYAKKKYMAEHKEEDYVSNWRYE